MAKTYTSPTDLTRLPVDDQSLSAGYAAMAADKGREAEAEAWSEGLILDMADEAHRGH